jgi:hypothetical protein
MNQTPTTPREIPTISGRADIDQLEYLIRLGADWFRENVVGNPEEEAQYAWESCFYTQMNETLLTETDFTAETLTPDSFDPDAVAYLEYVVNDGVLDFERNLKIYPNEIDDLVLPLDEMRTIHTRLLLKANAIAAYSAATYYD